MKSISVDMQRLGFGDNPSWYALVLFVRNLIGKFSIFSDEHKLAIQKYVFEELRKGDPSSGHLDDIIINLEKKLCQTTDMEELRQQFDLYKKLANTLEISVDKFIGDLLTSEEVRGDIVGKFGKNAVEVLEAKDDPSEIFKNVKMLVEEMLLHYKEEAQSWEKKARLLEKTVKIDPLLAPLHNRSALDNHLDELIKKQDLTGANLSVLMIDVDNFKTINDKFSHMVGDDVLRALAKIANSQALKHDWFVARYGGDEIVMVCDIPVETALFHADAIRMAVQKYEFRPRIGDKLADDPIKFTISIGVAGYEDGMSQDEFLNAADRAMYKVKGSGRNNVASLGL